MLHRSVKKDIYSDALSSVCLTAIRQAANRFYEIKSLKVKPLTHRDIKLVHGKETTLDGLSYVLKFQVYPISDQNKLLSCDQAILAINANTSNIQLIQYITIKENPISL